MSIEKITSKIISDAEEMANATLNQAQSDSDAIIENATKKAEEMAKKTHLKGEDEKQKLISRKKSVADIDGRKIVLAHKQELIAECFEKAVDKITSMDKEAYVNLLADIVKSTGKLDGELIFNSEEANNIGPSLIKKIGQILPESQIVISQETRDIRGGFLLKNGSIYINGTIEALVEEAKDKLVTEVAEALFQ
ncbi:MAG: V-type ATP synthase subunit E [Anaerovoracaceae bacterium]